MLLESFSNLLKHYEVFRPVAVALQIVVRCILFAFIILEMCLDLDWSQPLANWIDQWTFVIKLWRGTDKGRGRILKCWD